MSMTVIAMLRHQQCEDGKGEGILADRLSCTRKGYMLQYVWTCESAPSHQEQHIEMQDKESCRMVKVVTSPQYKTKQ
jgi:hypothetical protein